MSAQIIDGKRIAAEIQEEIKAQAAQIVSQTGKRPGLAVILIGGDPASQVYVRHKGKACLEAGFESETVTLPEETTQGQAEAEIERLNQDPRFHGILLQKPVPRGLDGDGLVARLAPEKDVDGLHPINVGLLALGQPRFIPCTPHGVIELLRRSGIPTSGRRATIVGRSELVGRPLAQLLSLKGGMGDATVCLCHSRTPDLRAETLQADILVAATGAPGLIRGDMVRPGAAVIDVGINRIEDPTRKSGFRLVGDVDYESARLVAGWITPVPGGVGPMTIAMLLQNTLEAARRALGLAP